MPAKLERLTNAELVAAPLLLFPALLPLSALENWPGEDFSATAGLNAPPPLMWLPIPLV
jgi:hypothetical protein